MTAPMGNPQKCPNCKQHDAASERHVSVRQSPEGIYKTVHQLPSAALSVDSLALCKTDSKALLHSIPRKEKHRWTGRYHSKGSTKAKTVLEHFPGYHAAKGGNCKDRTIHQLQCRRLLTVFSWANYWPGWSLNSLICQMGRAHLPCGPAHAAAFLHQPIRTHWDHQGVVTRATVPGSRRLCSNTFRSSLAQGAGFTNITEHY